MTLMAGDLQHAFLLHLIVIEPRVLCQGLAEEIARVVRDVVSAEDLATANEAMIAKNKTRRASDAEVAGPWAVFLGLGRSFAFERDLESRVKH
jgi:zinc protease